MMMMKKLPGNVAGGLGRRGCGKRKKEISQEKSQRNPRLMPKTGKSLMFTDKSSFFQSREVFRIDLLWCLAILKLKKDLTTMRITLAGSTW